MGMVGGGVGAFIGDVHRKAAAIDGLIELTAGAFSSSAEKSKRSGEELGLDPSRVYGSYEEMILAEKALPEGERIDFVSIVTPNHMHFGPSKLALEHGFPVVCDKPVTFSTAEAYELKAVIERSGLLFALTHNYTGYPMVKQARAMVKNGELGKIRKVVAQYHQGWLATKLEDSEQKQASWRTDPARSGKAGAFGDIGTHAENLLEYITDLKITALCADLTAFVPGRRLDDDGHVLLRLEHGAKGAMSISQIAVGEENNLKIQVYGEKAGLEWAQMHPNSLTVRHLDGHMQNYRTGVGALHPESAAHTRIPAGHPEGYLEAFANIYRNFAKCLLAQKNNQEVDPIYTDFPTVDDGIRGMEFIDAVVDSSAKQGWVKL
ncbi:MAG: Gfo/Idh/MocA family oxidoreductase [Saprospiraceae bacterium]|nr:Gfo/Idh/MocA family oxidoreductase [Saprospiraceae bacterium]